jgi:DNA-binding NarL/FixJ family response regulator
MRAEIVLLAAEGATNLAIAERLGITRVTVTTWRKRALLLRTLFADDLAAKRVTLAGRSHA